MNQVRSLPPTAARKSLPPPAEAQRRHDTIEALLVDEVWQRSRTSLPAAVLALLAAWPIVRGPAHVSDGVLVAYLSTIGVAVVRWLTALWAIPRLGTLSTKLKLRVALAGALLNGCAFGAANVFVYAHTDPLGFGLWLAIVTGLTGGSAVSLGSRPEVFAAYTVPTIGALVVVSLVAWRPGMTSLAVCFSLWILYSFAQVSQYRKTRREFIGMNLAQGAKNAELEAKNADLEAMTQRANRIFSALAETLPGRTLASRYKLESRIGSGGFAIVFRGMHTEIHRPVAVKIFRPQPGNDSALALERFRFEGTASSRTRHPNVVEVLDAGISDDGIPFIAMELLDGHSLDSELRDGSRLSIERAATLVGQACRGLAAAHPAGVIHRDVKPENIFIHHDDHGEIVKVLDFGIAKILDDQQIGAPLVTGTEMMLGTPHYMAPERFLGQACAESADTYSVGIILYRALSGKLPYEGTVAEIMLQAVSRSPRDLRQLAPDVDPKLASMIMAALNDDPTTRPDVAQIADALERIAHGGVDGSMPSAGAVR